MAEISDEKFSGEDNQPEDETRDRSRSRSRDADRDDANVDDFADRERDDEVFFIQYFLVSQDLKIHRFFFIFYFQDRVRDRGRDRESYREKDRGESDSEVNNLYVTNLSFNVCIKYFGFQITKFSILTLIHLDHR